jgi:hypothetical protein
MSMRTTKCQQLLPTRSKERYGVSRLISPDIRVEDNFLPYLDPEYQEDYPDEPLIQQAKKFYADFLADVIRHITRRFPNFCKRKALQFIFSIPPYWEVPDRRDTLEELAKWLLQHLGSIWR